MVLQTETYDFDEEVQRLEDNLGELEDALGEMGADHNARPELVELRTSLETQLNGVRWARDDAADADYLPAWDEDVDAVTLAGLTGGEVAGKQDSLPAGAGDGALRVEFVAAGSPHPEDDDVQSRGLDVPAPAPYVGPGQSEEERIAVVSDLPHPYQEWAHQQVDSLTSLSGNGKLASGEFAEELQRILAST